MVKNSIGIDIGRFHLRAVQIAQTAEGPRIERVFGKPTRRSTDRPVDMLRALTTEHGFDRHAEVTVCLPHQAIFFADLEVDSAALNRLRAGDPSSLRDDLPIVAEKAIVQVCSTRQLPNGRHSALVATTSTDLLREELTLLDEAKIHVTRIEAPITAACTAVGYNHPESQEGTAVIVMIDESVLSMAVLQQGSLIMIRNIPLQISRDSDMESISRQVTGLLDREIEITWRRLFGVDAQADLRVFLIASSATILPLAAAMQEEIGCQVIPVDPYACVEHDETIRVGFPICVAEGLALRPLLPREAAQVDFLHAHTTQTQDASGLRKELLVCGGLLAATVVVWILGLFVHLSRLESQYTHLKRQIQDVFEQTLPEEKCVNALVQLQQKLDSFRDDSGWLASFQPGRLPPLEILSTLSVHHPTDGNLEFDDVFIAGDSVRVTGHCDSFATLSGWQRLLEEIPGFEIVDQPNPGRDAKTGSVRFTLSLSSRKTVQ
ncbi:MAG: hypothetical protein GXY19_21495 [Phycisphaerae bacterium]|nr:hypothetical protein [Phycisphaerae bacterium]